jgi:hypothetical protein
MFIQSETNPKIPIQCSSSQRNACMVYKVQDGPIRLGDQLISTITVLLLLERYSNVFRIFCLLVKSITEFTHYCKWISELVKKMQSKQDPCRLEEYPEWWAASQVGDWRISCNQNLVILLCVRLKGTVSQDSNLYFYSSKEHSLHGASRSLQARTHLKWQSHQVLGYIFRVGKIQPVLSVERLKVFTYSYFLSSCNILTMFVKTAMETCSNFPFYRKSPGRS